MAGNVTDGCVWIDSDDTMWWRMRASGAHERNSELRRRARMLVDCYDDGEAREEWKRAARDVLEALVS
jgi:hypothetical protein